ncbi:hypothetical protein GCM10009555_046760 [Acrocarpospora macrocephala]|uniref:Lipoprotein n=1 Tax=Acrocarpospora macrocephala TaxID=150177 RepID=A0A5M3X136_9ACTN|nr:hypothetical protein [Acrocarpospora macrocephala]GES12018.1 hypothetical protein Amac_056150 [Acrocarpospora macrocephala]
MTYRAFVVSAVLAGGLAACASGGTGSPGASPGASADAQQALEIGRRFAQCGRDHGYPSFPDPVIDGTKLKYGDWGPEVQEQSRAVSEVPECKAIQDQLRALGDANAAPSAADLEKLKQFAQCLRDHGITGWPDPKADGSFPIIGTPLQADAKSDRSRAAQNACKQHWDRGFRVS